MAVVKVDVRFSDNVAELKERIAAGTGAMEGLKQSVNRTAESIGGQGLFIQANRLGLAIEQVGGVTKLTSAEIDRHSATLDKAIEKYKVMGMTAPPAMVELSKSLKDAGEAAHGAGEHTKGFFDGMVAHIAEGILIRDAVHEILGVIKELIVALPEIAMKGAGVADVEENFQRLTAQAGLLGDKLMGELRAGTHSTITDFELMKTANKDLAAGLNLTDQQFGTLAKGAFALAQATGVDVKSALETMNDAMLTGRTKALAMLTGKIDLTKAEQEYAKSLMTTADHLSEAGKLEGAREAILKVVGVATERLGEQTDGLDERVAQASTAWENFKENLGKTIATSPVLMAALDDIGTVLSNTFGTKQSLAIAKIVSFVETMISFGRGVAGVIETLWQWRDVIAVVAVGLVAYGGGLLAVKGYTVATTAATWLANAATVAYSATMSLLAGESVGLGAAMTVALGPIGLVAVAIAAVFAAWKVGQLTAVSDTFEKIGLRLQGYSSAQADAIIATHHATDAAAEHAKGMTAQALALEQVGTVAGTTMDEIDRASGAQDRATASAKRQAEMTQRSKDELSKTKAEAEKFAGAMRELDAVGVGWAGTLDTIDGSVVEAIKFYLAAGVSQNVLAEAYGLTAVQLKAVESAVKHETEASKVMAEIHNKIEAGMFGLKEAVGQVDNAELRLVRTQIALNDAMKMVERSIQPVVAGFKTVVLDLEHVGQKSDEIDRLKVGFAVADAAAAKFSKTLRGQMLEDLKRVPQMVANAFTGGGGLSGALQGIGSMVGSDLGEKLGKGISALGKMGGPIGAAIGSLAGPIIGFFTNVFSGGAEHLVNPIRQAFVDAAGGIAALDAKAHAAGVTLTAMLNAKNPEQYKKAIDDLNAALALQNARQGFIDVNGGLVDLDIKAHTAGVTLDKMLEAKTPEAYKKAIDELNAAFKFQDDSMKLLDDTVKKYGLKLEDLGPAYRKGKLDEEFHTLFQDQKILSAAGVEYAVILGKQAPKFQELINISAKTGTAIPLEMKPAIEKMIELGLLTEDSGKKMTDVSKLTFAETLDAKFQTIIEKIGLLVDAITRGLGPAIANIPTPKPIVIPLVWGDPGGRPERGGDDTAHAALGGLVTNHGVQYLAGGGNVLPFMARGTDTVPAMLTPGEGVVTRTGMSTLGTSGLRALNRGDRSGGGDLMQFSTAALERKLEAGLAAIASEARRAPDRTAMAVRDALLQARVGRN